MCVTHRQEITQCRIATGAARTVRTGIAITYLTPLCLVLLPQIFVHQLAEPEQKQSDIVFKETLRAPRVVNADSLSRFRRDPSPPFHGKHDAR